MIKKKREPRSKSAAEENDTLRQLLQEATSDPLPVYLREMGRVALLTREDEVSLARRIERGRRRVLNSLSRSGYVLAEIKKLGRRIDEGQIQPTRVAGGP